MDNFNSESMNQFPNQENQDLNFTQNNLSSPTPVMDPQDNEMSLENNGNNLNSAQEQKNSSNENSEENEEIKKKKGTRRSKRESEGRNYVCKMCSKSYLSYPALYTHYKQKHNTNNSSGRGRGRPKKETNEGENEKNNYNPTNNTYFMKEERTGKTSSETEINECIDKAFKDLYDPEQRGRIDSRGIKFYGSIEEHPFLNKFKMDNHDINKTGDEHQIADSVFIEYLNKMSAFCNPNYFTKLIIFVTLFREHSNQINVSKLKEDEQNKVYTEIKDAEDVPDSSNEFITDFINPEEKNNDLGFNKEECIDLTQNLCYWMYENNYTCSKLSLIREK
jgi:hypothetical protein